MAGGWLLLVVAAPILWTPLAAVLYAAASLICHQIPERSFHLQGSQLPVCARCAGLYGGGALGALVGVTVAGRAPGWAALAQRVLAGHRRSLPEGGDVRSIPWPWIGTILAALPTIATFVLEWGLGWRISNTVRAVAAVPLGGAVAFVVVGALATLHYD
jgi:hypothetical protein